MLEWIAVSLAVVVAGLYLILFVTVRRNRDKQEIFWKKRLPPPDEQGITLAEHLPLHRQQQGWSLRMDRAFVQMIKRTGLDMSGEQALALIAVAGVALASALYLWREDLWLAGIGLVAGMALPLVVYLILQTRWRRQIRGQLPDVLFLLARSLRAGLSLEQGLETVARHGHKPLADEIHRAVEQIKLGLTIPAALEGVAQRIRLADFDAFVTVIMLHRNLGGNLTMLLDRVASSTRDRNLFRGHFLAATALHRATAYCLAAGAPLIFLGFTFMQPDFVSRFVETASGIRLLVTASFLEVLGLIWIGLLLRNRY